MEYSKIKNQFDVWLDLNNENIVCFLIINFRKFFFANQVFYWIELFVQTQKADLKFESKVFAWN